MIYLLATLFLLSSTFLFLAVLQRIFLSDKRLETRLKHYLNIEGEQPKKPFDRRNFQLLVQIRLANAKLRSRISSKKNNKRLEHLIKSSGFPIKPEEYTMFQLMATAMVGLIFYLFTGNIFLLMIGAIIGFFIPKIWLLKKQQQRLRKFNESLPDMITTVIGSLRAGFSFPQALKTVVSEAEAPMREEMEVVLKEMQYGSSVEEALANLKERVPSEDLELMIQAIVIQRQVGGNLATVLEKIVETIRDRTKIQQQIVTLTAQGRLSGMVIGLLPIVLAFVLYLIEPDYIGTLFHHPIGIAMIIIGAIGGVLGFIFIRKVTTIEV